MNRIKLLAIGVVLIGLALLLSHNFLDNTGLFSLPETEEKEAPKLQEPEEQEIKAGLSLTVLKPTTLEASVLSEETLSRCPEEAEVTISVKNTGNAAAEKMFLHFGSGIKVLGCQNCSLDELAPKQEIEAKTRLCLESASPNRLVVGSANSNTIELGLEE